MGLISTEAEVILGGSNIKWLEGKGYKVPTFINKNGKIKFDLGAKLLIKVQDLTNNSMTLVDVKCDGCGKISEGTPWKNYKMSVKEDGKYYCLKCSRNGCKKWISFWEWCYINLSEEEAYYILNRWDYTLNIDESGKMLTPNDVSYSSHGFNQKGYWFKCLENPKHKSEQKHING